MVEFSYAFDRWFQSRSNIGCWKKSVWKKHSKILGEACNDSWSNIKCTLERSFPSFWEKLFQLFGKAFQAKEKSFNASGRILQSFLNKLPKLLVEGFETHGRRLLSSGRSFQNFWEKPPNYWVKLPKQLGECAYQLCRWRALKQTPSLCLIFFLNKLIKFIIAGECTDDFITLSNINL